MSFFRLPIALGLTIVLSACGGGGDDKVNPSTSTSSTSTAAASTYPLRSAHAKFFTNTSPRPFTVIGTTEGGTPFSGTGLESVIAPSAASFEGKIAQQVISTTTYSVTINGITSPSATTETAYYDSNFTLLGLSFSSAYEVAVGTATLPTVAQIGDAGPWVSTTVYNNHTKTSTYGTRSCTYTLTADTPPNAVLRFFCAVTNSAGTIIYNSTQTWRVTPAGEFTPVLYKGTNTQNSYTITMTY